MTTPKEALSKIETHEKECSIRYSNIEKRLEDGAKRFDKLENIVKNCGDIEKLERIEKA